MSRVTLHRIEKGEPPVTMGAWSNAIAALGMPSMDTQEQALWQALQQAFGRRGAHV
jgi:hypothetical protein